jgi:adenosine kinase
MLAGLDWDTIGRMGALAATYALEEYGTQNHRYTLQEFVARYREVFGAMPGIAKLLERS